MVSGKTLGYAVLEAEDGKAALNIIGSNRQSVDLTLTDVVMKRMSGPELALRLIDSNRTMKVVYMSGNTGELLANQGADFGIRMLEKPFTQRGTAEDDRRRAWVTGPDINLPLRSVLWQSADRLTGVLRVALNCKIRPAPPHAPPHSTPALARLSRPPPLRPTRAALPPFPLARSAQPVAILPKVGGRCSCGTRGATTT
jgi:CheY-like chemotaxis protein